MADIRAAVATATYRDTWAGDVPAYLVPQVTKRGGLRCIAFRWMTARGQTCDGLKAGYTNIEAMVRHAQRHALFASVKAV